MHMRPIRRFEMQNMLLGSSEELISCGNDEAKHPTGLHLFLMLTTLCIVIRPSTEVKEMQHKALSKSKNEVVKKTLKKQPHYKQKSRHSAKKMAPMTNYDLQRH